MKISVTFIDGNVREFDRDTTQSAEAFADALTRAISDNATFQLETADGHWLLIPISQIRCVDVES